MVVFYTQLQVHWNIP